MNNISFSAVLSSNAMVKSMSLHTSISLAVIDFLTKT